MLRPIVFRADVLPKSKEVSTVQTLEAVAIIQCRGRPRHRDEIRLDKVC